jgi:hypothetical protein
VGAASLPFFATVNPKPVDAPTAGVPFPLGRTDVTEPPGRAHRDARPTDGAVERPGAGVDRGGTALRRAAGEPCPAREPGAPVPVASVRRAPVSRGVPLASPGPAV